MSYVSEENTSGQPEFADVELADVIDVAALQEMMDDYYALTGIGVGIIDLKGTVLVGTGWQDICVKFHRAVAESCAFCSQSDITLSSGVPPGTFREYRCKNNMWDIATPIMLGDRHIGNIFLGQFLYDDEEPDYELFRAQARRFGYDEEEYIAALDRVPRWSREKVRTAMGFYSKMAQMISRANYNNVILVDTLARREQAEKAFRIQFDQMCAIFDSIEAVLYVADLESFELLYLNSYGASLFGEEWKGKKCFEVLQAGQGEPCRFCNNEKLVRDGIAQPPCIWEFQNTKTGQWFQCIDRALNWTDGRLVRLEVAFDITERKRLENERLNLEKQLFHAQKMESLGVLAGGIAHDFNNILTSIVGNTDLALMRLNPESPVIDNLKRVEKSAVRATDLAKQMLAYSGKGKFVVESIDLNRLVEEMGHMLQVSISKKAVLRFNLAQPLPSIEADATQIRQVVMNLVINASEAIGDKSGVIAITTGCINCDRNYLKNVWLNSGIPEGLYVYLEIADTGCGMDKETQIKMFDPFFTTKFTGRGLGMAAVQGIVRGHKGAIKVYSELGKGSSFKVLLPASELPAELFNGTTKDVLFSGEGTVLLVDDEETVLAIGGEMLREIGFTVITAKDGREALDAYKAHPGLFCVILDLTMPHVDGEQAFRELKMLDPDVKVIMSSGYSEYEVTQKFAGKGLAGFIQKPYKISELRGALASIVEDARP